jgi:gliding motility-associated lipoprotein GldH
MRQLFIIFMLNICIASCMPSNQYHKKYFLPNHQWSYADCKTFDFEITDTTSLYNLQFLMQHAEAYAYSNVWIKMTTTYPNGKLDSQRIEVALALPDGHWLGRGGNGLVEHTMNITPNATAMRFVEKGVYQIKIEQMMRINPLMNIEYIGLQVEKVVSKKH